MKTFLAVGCMLVVFLTGLAETSAESTTSPLEFTLNNIDGEPVPLSTFKGNVILMVNVASKCGNTPQYEQLQSLYKTYQEQGFVVLGFPANNFGGQEPGTNKEIKQFCSTNYNVTFPMFSKISVKGEDKHPLYGYLTSKSKHNFGGEVKWNFEKFLIGRDGSIKARFAPGTQPNAEQVIKAIKAELKS